MEISRKWTMALLLAMALTAGLLTGCGSDDDDPPTGSTTTLYGGSIPRGDYVTAAVDQNQITLKNMTLNNELTLSYGVTPEVQEVGSSIIRLTDSDGEGNRYLLALSEGNVLAAHKLDSELDPIISEPPIYMFRKSDLAAADLQGRSFNFMELYTGASGIELEIGIVGFDGDADGRLYGAAYDSETDAVYSITDDAFSLSLTEGQPDGSLVLWEDGVDNWDWATTLTGSGSGPVVMDHGPGAGGGAGFAFPQVTETDPDVFWSTVAGDYFLIVQAETDGAPMVDYFRCTVAQTTAGEWAGTMAVYSLESAIPFIREVIVPLDTDRLDKIDASAGFDQAQSEAVRNAAGGRGIFMEDTENDVDPDPYYFVTFDPEGNYIMGIKFDGGDGVTGYGLGIRDPNWTIPEDVPR